MTPQGVAHPTHFSFLPETRKEIHDSWWRIPGQAIVAPVAILRYSANNSRARLLMARLVRRVALLSVAGLLVATTLLAQDKQPAPKIPGTETYPLGPDSQEHPDVPKGRFLDKTIK